MHVAALLAFLSMHIILNNMTYSLIAFLYLN